MLLVEDENFINKDYTETRLVVGDYEMCTFSNCVFSKSSLSNFTFTECTFENCDLSLAKIDNTAFKDVTFKDCKLLGLRFEDCNQFLFEVNFESCQLDLSSFYKCAMKGSRFIKCSLKEVDFTESNLTAASFQECNLLGSIFDRTILEKTDFRTAANFAVDPEINQMRKALFSRKELEGLLLKYDLKIE